MTTTIKEINPLTLFYGNETLRKTTRLYILRYALNACNLDFTKKAILNLKCFEKYFNKFSYLLEKDEDDIFKFDSVDKTGKPYNKLFKSVFRSLENYIQNTERGLKKMKPLDFSDKYVVDFIGIGYIYVSEKISKNNEKTLCGVIDFYGNIIIPLVYDKIFSFYSGICRVIRNDKFGYVDFEGNEFIPCVHTSLERSSCIVIGNKNGKDVCYDILGNVLTNFDYDFLIDDYSVEPPLRFFNKGVIGIFNINGDVFSKCKYDFIGRFHYERASFLINGKYGFIDKLGNEVILNSYDWVGDFSESCSVIEKDNKYGYIDINGKHLTKCEYDVAFPMSRGKGLFKKNNLWGEVNIMGEEVYFANLDIFIELNNEYYSKKDEYIKFCYSKSDSNFLRTKRNGKWGFLNRKGELIIPCKYELAMDFDNSFINLVKYNGIWYKIDTNGTEFII